MSINKLPKNFKQCATCALWAGKRTPEFGGYSKFDTNEKGKCCGGAFNNLSMSAQATCNKWELWPAIR